MKTRPIVQVIVVCGGRAYLACLGAARAEEPQAAKLEQKLRSIVIPEVNLREARLAEVIDFLVESSRQLDPEKQGVNIVVAPRTAPAGTSPFGGKTNAAPAEPRITLHVRQASVLEVLKIVMDWASLKTRIRGNVLLLVPLNTPDSDRDNRS